MTDTPMCASFRILSVTFKVGGSFLSYLHCNIPTHCCQSLRYQHYVLPLALFSTVWDEGLRISMAFVLWLVIFCVYRAVVAIYAEWLMFLDISI